MGIRYEPGACARCACACVDRRMHTDACTCADMGMCADISVADPVAGENVARERPAEELQWTFAHQEARITAVGDLVRDLWSF